MRITFTHEAIAGMDPTKLGELIKDRVARGVDEIAILPIDQVIGRMAAMGARVVETTPALEVETSEENR